MHPITSTNIHNKIVLVRLDLNCPLYNGVITDDYRIKKSLDTLYLLQKYASKVHILTHLGRPKKSYNSELSTQILLPELSKYIDNISFSSDYTDKDTQFVLHENLRFDASEEDNTSYLADIIMNNLHPDVYVNDAFACSHRAHMSIVELPKRLKSYAGIQLYKEIEALQPYVNSDKQRINGLLMVLGGAKAKEKIPVIEYFLERADSFILGGGVANTALKSLNYNIGVGIYDDSKVDVMRHIMAMHKNILLPKDAHTYTHWKDIDTYNTHKISDIPDTEGLWDIGEETIKSYISCINNARVVIMNGGLGAYENPIFAKGTYEILTCVRDNHKNNDLHCILGGGDTVGFAFKQGFKEDDFSFVSTGGGAMIEYLSGITLPGIEVLKR